MQNQNILNSDKINHLFKLLFSNQYSGASKAHNINVQFSDDIMLPMSLN
tara:strand:- start:57 stop:203 length:147 start_codon:yes stop_codon:yes gene_type:complete